MWHKELRSIVTPLRTSPGPQLLTGSPANQVSNLRPTQDLMEQIRPYLRRIAAELAIERIVHILNNEYMVTGINRYAGWPLCLLFVAAIVFGGYGRVICLDEDGRYCQKLWIEIFSTYPLDGGLGCLF